MKPTIERIREIQKMLDEKSYTSEQAQFPRWRRILNFCVLVFHSFQKNRGPVRAASLAYTTVLSLVPVLAVVVSISTVFLQHNNANAIDELMDYVVKTVAPQLNLIQSDAANGDAASREAVVQKIKEYINAVNSGTVGVTAGIALVFVAISVLSSVENTFNDIWGVTRGRTWSARIVQYWAAITLAPIFIITALGMTGAAASAGNQPAKAPMTIAAGTTNLIATRTNQSDVISATGTRVTTRVVEEVQPGFYQNLIRFFQKARIIGLILPFLVLSVFLTLFYRLMPATKVRWEAAAVGGLVGGGLLHLNNLFSVIYLSRVLSYSKIYGSLGAVPIFLVGLYFSWLIILLGAQVAYAHQNRQAYIQEKQAESINQRGREFVAIRLMAYIAQAFYAGEKPPTRLQMAKALAIPSQLAASVLCAMVAGKLLVEVSGEETGYSPARPIEKISLEHILGALRTGQGGDLATADDPTRAVLREQYERVVLAEMHAAGAVNLHHLVTRIASLPQLTQTTETAVSKIAHATA